ncbi:hypothetical protein [Dyadobacter sp. Leaf189]|uniref:hypothetical protein n=1 Tax=Dyadobacter sp. Leaf189 TaxID=1736295 RepID=UPI000ACFABFB|nr:hypothetical protein [Dyadobacter sp. Leaf189]
MKEASREPGYRGNLFMAIASAIRQLDDADMPFGQFDIHKELFDILHSPQSCQLILGISKECRMITIL